MINKLIILSIFFLVTGYIYGYAHDGISNEKAVTGQGYIDSDNKAPLTQLPDALPADVESAGRVDLSVPDISAGILFFMFFLLIIMKNYKNIFLVIKTYSEYKKYHNRSYGKQIENKANKLELKHKKIP